MKIREMNDYDDSINLLAAELIFSDVVKDKGEDSKVILEKLNFSNTIKNRINEELNIFPLSNWKIFTKKTKLEDKLLRKLGLGYMGLISNGSSTEASSNDETLRRLYDRISGADGLSRKKDDRESDGYDPSLDIRKIQYGGVFFSKVWISSFKKYRKFVEGELSENSAKEFNFAGFFLGSYKKRRACIVKDHITDRDERQEYKIQVISEYLGEIVGKAPSQIEEKLEYLTVDRCFEVAKELFVKGGIIEGREELPLDVKKRLLDILSTDPLVSVDKKSIDEDGNEYGSESENKEGLEQSRIQEDNEMVTYMVLQIMDEVKDLMFREYIYYWILSISDQKEVLDPEILSRVPKDFGVDYRHSRNIGQSRNEFLGERWRLQPDTFRKKIKEVQQQLCKSANDKFKN